MLTYSDDRVMFRKMDLFCGKMESRKSKNVEKNNIKCCSKSATNSREREKSDPNHHRRFSSSGVLPPRDGKCT